MNGDRVKKRQGHGPPARLQKDSYLPRGKAELVAYYLTPGPAARRGDNPVQLMGHGLSAYYPAAVAVERLEVQSWTTDQKNRRFDRLAQAGRHSDVERLERQRSAPYPY